MGSIKPRYPPINIQEQRAKTLGGGVYVRIGNFLMLDDDHKSFHLINKMHKAL